MGGFKVGASLDSVISLNLIAKSYLLKATFTTRAVFSGYAPTDPLKIHHVSLTAFRADTLYKLFAHVWRLIRAALVAPCLVAVPYLS